MDNSDLGSWGNREGRGRGAVIDLAGSRREGGVDRDLSASNFLCWKI